MESHHTQQQMDVRTEGEILVRGHVRRRKPDTEAPAAKRHKPYPTKWGRGKAYSFGDARIVLDFAGTPFLSRLRIAICAVLAGRTHVEGSGLVIAAKGTKPTVMAVSALADANKPAYEDELIVGPLT